MPKYFQDMPVVGKPLVNANAENEAELKEIEKNIHDKVEEILAKGITTEGKIKRARSAFRHAAYQRSGRRRDLLPVKQPL